MYKKNLFLFLIFCSYRLILSVFKDQENLTIGFKVTVIETYPVFLIYLVDIHFMKILKQLYFNLFQVKNCLQLKTLTLISFFD